MKCGRLHLQERLKPKIRGTTATSAVGDRARRYCQRRMIDPALDEDPRWNEGVIERFHCKIFDEDKNPYETYEEPYFNHNSTADMFLSVQTLQFQGDSQVQKLPRTCFKYKALAHEIRHRMFIKEIVESCNNVEEDCSSQQNNYYNSPNYLDDYVKYIMNSVRSRPSTGKSSLPTKEERSDSKDKAVQVELKRSNSILKGKPLRKPKDQINKSVKLKEEVMPRVLNNDGVASSIEEANVSYHKSGKRKSITISRVQSPETVQVIRVDVVCNYSNSSSTISNYGDMKKPQNIEVTPVNDMKGAKHTKFTSKYLLTKSIKSLDEKLSSGANVTLLCKTYRLADRVRRSNDDRKQINSATTKTFSFRSKANALK